jgi:hypothetical protein
MRKLGCAAKAIATRVGNDPDKVKVERKSADDLTAPDHTGNLGTLR